MRHLRDILVSWGPAGVFLFAAIDGAGVPNPGGTDLLLIALTIAQPASRSIGVPDWRAGSHDRQRTLRNFQPRRRISARPLYFFRTGTAGEPGSYGLITVFIPALPIPFFRSGFAASAAAMRVGAAGDFAGDLRRALALFWLGLPRRDSGGKLHALGYQSLMAVRRGRGGAVHHAAPMARRAALTRTE